MTIPNKTTEKMLRAFNETLAIMFAHECGLFKVLREEVRVGCISVASMPLS